MDCRFVFIRHCETDWNVRGLIQGRTDIPLNNRGREQAESLAKRFKDFGISRIVSSPLSRASETASIIGFQLGLGMRHDDRLIECGFGKLEGLTKEEIVTQFGMDILVADAEPYDFRPFDGEDREAVLSRHLAALDDLSRAATGETMLIVGHGRGLNTLLSDFGEERLARGGVCVLQYPRK